MLSRLFLIRYWNGQLRDIDIFDIINHMARRWTKKEENKYRLELQNLYICKNKTMSEISDILNIAPSSVYERLKRLNIKPCREKKEKYNNQRSDFKIPQKHNNDLAEFFGIMLGDGHVSHFQTFVTLGTKELDYAKYVAKLMEKIFAIKPKISIRKNNYKDVYFGSVDITKWLKKEGLVSNKVKAQVGAPEWIFSNEEFMKRFVRGFFDTDGSVYKLKYGVQISLNNHSFPLLEALQLMLIKLGYKPSRISSYSVYITKVPDIKRFFSEIRPANKKHVERFKEIIK